MKGQMCSRIVCMSWSPVARAPVVANQQLTSLSPSLRKRNRESGQCEHHHMRTARGHADAHAASQLSVATRQIRTMHGPAKSVGTCKGCCTKQLVEYRLYRLQLSLAATSACTTGWGALVGLYLRCVLV